MKLRITNNNFDLDGIDISLPLLYSILETSNENLETDLNNSALSFVDLENGQHLWAITWRPLRLDDLEGVGLYYFIKEIINHLKLNQDVTKLTLEGEFDLYFKKYLKTNYPDLKVKRRITTSYLKSTIGYYLGPLNYILKTILNTRKPEKIDGQIWFSSPINISKHRYKHLLNLINKTKAFYGGRLEVGVNSKNFGQSINFSEYLTLSDIFESFKNGVRLCKIKRKHKPNELVDYAIKNNKIQHFMATLLKEKSVANAIAINKPEKILFTTANTYPPARIVSRQAYLNNIPFIIVACRPMFTKARLEERLIHADKLKINDTHVADTYAVWDEYSKQTLIGQGVSEKSIYVTSPDPVQSQKSKSVIKFENAILVLFTHEESLNRKFVKELVQLNDSKDIIIRQHPLMPLTVLQLEELSSKFNIITDITSKDYSNFEFVNVLAITVNSTAIIEAVSYGCGAIWMPYLNSRSLVFFEIMNELGVMMESIHDLENLLSSNDSRLKEIITDCQEVYINKFKAKDETLEFLENIKLI